MLSATRITRGARVFVCLAALAVVQACTSHIANSPYIKAALVDENYEAALERIEKIDKGGAQLLYLYEKGLVLHYQGRYNDSNEAFHEAEILYEDLYTKSISREAAALITSDNIVKYRGQRYEAALIHYYKVFNYLYLGDPQGAVVECRKIGELLDKFVDSGHPEDNDPFLRYLTAMVFREFGDNNDAEVSLRIAARAYDGAAQLFGVEPPRSLYCDIARSRTLREEFAAAAAYGDSVRCADGSAGDGALLLFLECGYVPHRIEENLIIPIYKDEIKTGMDREKYAEELYDRRGAGRNYERKLEYVLRVAVPELVSNPYPFVEADVSSSAAQYSAAATIVENLDYRAHREFEMDRPGIYVKTIMRGLAKYLAKKEAAEEDQVAGWLVNIFNVATESADTRCWSTLPAWIQMVRLPLPEGVHDVEITLPNAYSGPDESFVIPDVEISAGRTTFLNWRVY